MTLAGSLAGSARRQARNLARLGLGRSVTTPSFAAMTLDDDDLALADRWLQDRSRWNDDGTVTNYEREFAAWNGSRAAYAFMSGREALSACIAALDLRAGDEVVLPGYTCVVVSNALRFAGLAPAFCDIELETYGPDVADVELRLTARTRAVLIQHLYGLVCRDYEALIDLTQRRGIALIEDCAHATGAVFRGQKVGNYGSVAFYSSEVSKVFSTITGGIAVTNDDRIARRLAEVQRLSPRPSDTRIEDQLNSIPLAYYRFKHPQRWWRHDWAQMRWGRHWRPSTSAQEIRGERPREYGCRMPAPIAALGSNQLRKIDAYNARRRETARRWDRWCEQHAVAPPRVIAGSEPVFLRYPLLVDAACKYDQAWAERSFGVTTGSWFESHLHPSSQAVAGCPRAAAAVARCINLPTLLD